MRKIPFTSAVRYRTCGKVQKNEIFFSPYLTEEQTISKWELAQSYPDFQRLVLLSDYFGQSLDVLVKDIDVQDVREKNLSEKQLSSIYEDVNTAKSTINSVVNILAILGFTGLALAILAGLLWG